MHLDINLTNLAAILWCGMLIIAGSVWVLASQVRALADILDGHARSAAADAGRGLRRASARSRPRTASRSRTSAACRRVPTSPR